MIRILKVKNLYALWLLLYMLISHFAITLTRLPKKKSSCYLKTCMKQKHGDESSP